MAKLFKIAILLILANTAYAQLPGIPYQAVVLSREDGQELPGVDDDDDNILRNSVVSFEFCFLQASANVRAAGTILTSDARLKTDIVEVEDALAIIEKLQPVQYRKKQSITSEDYSKHEFGFIAQEVRKLLPSLVTEGMDKDKLLALDYNSLISILTKAIQQQQVQIESLKGENETLQSYLGALNTQISLIQEALEQENILEVDKNTLKD